MYEIGSASISEPPGVIKDIIEPETRRILFEKGNMLRLGRDFLKRITFGIIRSKSWYCDATVEARIGYDGIDSFNIIDFKRVTCDFYLYLDDEDKPLFKVTSTLYDGEVEIVNIDEFIISVNQLFCYKCGKRHTNCICRIEDNNDDHESYRPISINGKTIVSYGSKNKRLIPKIFDSTGLFKNTAKMLGESEKTEEINLEKYMPVINGICQTFKMKQDIAMDLARRIIKSNKFITEEGLASEIIKHSR